MASIFITGSTDGLGRAAAEALLDEGHQVVLHARTQLRADAIAPLAARSLGVVIGDLADGAETHAIADLVNEIGAMDAIIHNAGIYRSPSRNATPEGHARTLAVNTLAAADRIAAHWRTIESAHDARRELADHLVNRLSGKRSVMYEVATRDIPERTVLCLKRNVDPQGAWALGKEFIAVLRSPPLPRMEGRMGAMLSIYWGEVSADSDGPVEWCKPVPEPDAKALALHYPEFTLRTERAHREAYVAIPNDALPSGPGGDPGVKWQLASEALGAWAEENGIHPERFLENFGVRVTYLWSGPITATSAPYCDFALPFGVER